MEIYHAAWFQIPQAFILVVLQVSLCLLHPPRQHCREALPVFRLVEVVALLRLVLVLRKARPPQRVLLDRSSCPALQVERRSAKYSLAGYWGTQASKLQLSLQMDRKGR
jgi:hypothetical protein